MIDQIANINQPILLLLTTSAHHPRNLDLHNHQAWRTILSKLPMPAPKTIQHLAELLVLLDLSDTRFVQFGRLQPKYTTKILACSFIIGLALSDQLILALFSELSIRIVRWLVLSTKIGVKFGDIVVERYFIFGSPDRLLLALATNILDLHCQLVPTKLLQHFLPSLLVQLHHLTVFIPPDTLKIEMLSQAVYPQTIDQNLLRHLVVLSRLIVFVFQSKKRSKAMLPRRSKIMRCKYVFRVFVHEDKFVFDLQHEFAPYGFKTALEHPEEMLARTVLAFEGFYFQIEEQQIGIAVDRFVLVQSHYFILDPQLSSLRVF